jgi:type IV pilus assembly protein PilC
MAEFAYKGTNRRGSSVKSKIAARTESEALTKLRLLGIRVHSIGSGRIKSKVGGTADIGGLIRKLINPSAKHSTAKMGTAELMVFTKQMSTLIDAGIAIVQALDMLSQQAMDPGVREMIDHIREQVEGGKDFATALEKHPQAFDTTFISLVRAGAQSGQLDVMLKKLTIYIEKANKLKKQLVSAMSYPTVVLIIAFALTTAMLMFVVPMFAKNYTDSGKELPGLTQMVIDASNWLKSNFHIVIGALVAGGFAFVRWKNTKTGRAHWDKALISLPLFGPLLTKIAIARFTGTMATLVSAGVALPEALKICSVASGNVIIEGEINMIEQGIIKGKSMSEMMQKIPRFPTMVSGMVGIGESTGRLDAMLEKIALVYEEDVEAALAAALKLVEPAMFILVGGIVGFILLAMYLPIFDMAGTVT